MNEPELNPLGDDVRQLLQAERDAPGPDGAALDRVWTRVQATVAQAPASTPAESGAGGGSTGLIGKAVIVAVVAAAGTWFVAQQPTGPEVDIVGEAPAVTVAEPETLLPAKTETQPAPVSEALPASGAGTAVGSEIGAATSTRPPAVTSPPPTALPATAAERELPPASEPASTEARKTRPRRSDLAAERTLLDQARIALRAGRPGAALRTARSHRRRFPLGVLAEERDSILVQALASVGRKDDARSRGQRFLDRYPGSVYRPVIEAIVEKGAE